MIIASVAKWSLNLFRYGADMFVVIVLLYWLSRVESNQNYDITRLWPNQGASKSRLQWSSGFKSNGCPDY